MTLADICDLAYAVLLEQFEGDARAMTAGGLRDEPVEVVREMLDERLLAEPERAKHVSADVLRLNRALGVA